MFAISCDLNHYICVLDASAIALFPGSLRAIGCNDVNDKDALLSFN
ncbi:hypothetical protein H6S82_12005 [Planktothrix sp. FACHB-1355]|uniref:Uncharacterized protein n=1 Tax=Aerosakkonema funiforme FACHB-1375 TaxID=2949571 RepID=A0A926ZKL5_9CYAN|nr:MULTISPECIES: hypothetical protein [Oscillatoriales]MBD2184131.1 hypothetical protein [Aerosakkonema funiforme FACHB-1375]MBD3559583.1 hypothetical protein [Planktothrix sp. FACHB-1355]